jgi:hypothetical protein
MFNEVSGDLKIVTNSMGKMAHAMEHEAAIQEKAMSEDPMQKLRERVVNEVRRLEFTGAEVIDIALVFVKISDQMGVLFALPEPLRREYIVNMLRGNFLNFSLRWIKWEAYEYLVEVPLWLIILKHVFNTSI